MTSEDVQKSFHYLYPAEVPALKSLVAQLPANSLVINVGAGSGTSGLAILEARPDVYLVTIDIENNDSPLGSLYSERDVMREAGFGNQFDVRWSQLHMDSKLAGETWIVSGERNPNMVFVDGDHSYEGCKGDIEAWFPHIVDGGIIAVHDFLKGDLKADPDGPHPMNWPGVDSAVSELLIPNFEMIMHVASLVAFRKRE